ncbi:hypothetical protein [Allorhizocola rhizosphaerae]|uniref:hypothetical protein n=1 Tax=Allorhizocola rhizosphaerae TaxID=1872709 RepID=UPI0013C2A160|nr:hypothetical protein [Allorhizocola rhizosphaerae]
MLPRLIPEVTGISELMFGKNRNTTSDAASEAWHELRDAATDRAKDLGDEARRRTLLAWDAMAGRPAPKRTWPMVRAGIIGVLVGWGASEFYRRRRTQVNDAVANFGNELREAKHNVDERLAKAKATPGSPIEKAKAAVSTSGNTNSTPQA